MFMKCILPVKKKRKILLATFHEIPIPRKTNFFSTSWLFYLDSMDLWHYPQNIQKDSSKNVVYKF